MNMFAKLGKGGGGGGEKAKKKWKEGRGRRIYKIYKTDIYIHKTQTFYADSALSQVHPQHKHRLFTGHPLS